MLISNGCKIKSLRINRINSIAHWSGQNLFDIPKPIHLHWHPEASHAIVRMLGHKANVESILKENILLIEELKNHMAFYKSGKVQQSVKKLLSIFKSKF